MNDLFDFALRAAGGVERIRSFRSVSAQLHHTEPFLIVGVDLSDFHFE
jgi:hypothetical protein